MISNFSFLGEKFPEIMQLGAMAERYWRSDAQSCIIKTGMLCEGLTKIMAAMDHVSLPERCDAVERINILQNRGVLPHSVADALHLIRKARNKAVHDGYAPSEEKTRYLLEIACTLCGWFYQTYVDESYRAVPFQTPDPETPPESADSSDNSDEKLIDQAALRAAAAPAVPETDRRTRAEKASRLRHISEAETRLLIDEQLRKVGWEADTEHLRYSRGTRPAAGHNMAIAEWPTDSKIGHHGFADYALFIGTKMVAVIEAKAMHKDIPSVIDQQCKDYASHIKERDARYILESCRAPYGVPFVFATNGRPYMEQWKEKSGIWFQDLREDFNAPEALRGWMSPAGMEALLERNVPEANRRLASMSRDFLTDKDGLNLREYQVRAVEAAEKAVMNGSRNILLAMATGTGKTRTVLGLMYRFLKSGRFRRILFLVDRTALGTQALDAFSDVNLEDFQPLNAIYDVKELTDKTIDKETRVHVATVQGMMKRILYSGEEDSMPAVTDYDLVIVDEAHRGYILDRDMTDNEQLYRDQRDYQSKYREVMEYFDAVKIGLTATPALQTTAIFGHPVFKYTYREAVIDGFLVDHDAPHQLKTKLSMEGIHYRPGDNVVRYDPETGAITNEELLDDELDFDIEQFNKTVVNENFNRAVLQEIAEHIDPEDISSGKTLIYAVNDSHADMIVRILKEIYRAQYMNTDAVMKITGSIGDRKKVLEAIRRFKNENFPSIAVTVDLLTTGIDVPEITRLVFMRRVRSRILFEQMLGRATRLCPKIKKSHFEIYDAVDVYSALEPVSSMKPVVANPTTSFSQLLDGLETMEEKPLILAQINQILGKLQRRRHSMSDELMQHFMDMTGKRPEDFVEEIEGMTPGDAKKRLLDSRNLFQLMQNESIGRNSVVISYDEDELVSHSRSYGNNNLRPEDYLESFARFIRENRNEVAALEIICTRPADLTRESLKSLSMALQREGFTERQLNSAVSQMSNKDMAADIISFIRRYGISARLMNHEERIKTAIQRLKAAHDFSGTELRWIDRMEKYLLNESVLSTHTFDENVLFREKGGFGTFNRIFNNRLASLVSELNGYLYDDGDHAA